MGEAARTERGTGARSQPEAQAARTAAAPAEAARRSAHPLGQAPLHTAVMGAMAAAADGRRWSAGGRGPRHPSTAARDALPRGRSEGGPPHGGAHRSEGVRHGWYRSWLEERKHQRQGGYHLPLCLGVEDVQHDAGYKNQDKVTRSQIQQQAPPQMDSAKEGSRMNHRPPTEMTGKSSHTSTGTSDNDTNETVWFSTTKEGLLLVMWCASHQSPDSNTRSRAFPPLPTERDSRDLKRSGPD